MHSFTANRDEAREGTMEKQAQNIQDSFLNNARRDKTVITIYLLSGVKLSGRIRSFDKYCLVLETSNQEQLIFKHAISTVVTQRGGGRDMPAERHGAAPLTTAGPAAAPASSGAQSSEA
jgi:host factor-I protein